MSAEEKGSGLGLLREKRGEFEELALPHLDALFRTALRMTRKAEEAEDLVQEAYLRAFRAYHTFEPGTNIRAWLFKILSNAFLTEIRKRQNEPGKVDLDDVVAFVADPKSSMDPGVGSAEGVALRDLKDPVIRGAVEELPEEYRLVLLLTVVEGFSYKEAAHILTLPIGTVMSRLFRAKRMLKEKLARQKN